MSTILKSVRFIFKRVVITTGANFRDKQYIENTHLNSQGKESQISANTSCKKLLGEVTVEGVLGGLLKFCWYYEGNTYSMQNI